ncbi:MAG: 50S ribosomal protein L11 methyltransferase [Ignavibacteriaceae bacterium]|jgi:ribosomal protein L11 methyltransferase
MKSYYEVTIETDPFNTEELSGLLWEFQPLGILENDLSLSLSFNVNDNLEQKVENFLRHLVKGGVINSFNYSIKEIEDKNWNEEWEKNLKVIKVTDRIVIKPSFRDYSPSAEEVVITIDPKMSFGTGEHQTTKLMLSMCEKYIKPKIKVIDVGTGTGVLAIASVLLGADFALGIDNDEWCYENALENIAQNHVLGKVEFRLAELGTIAEDHFDLLLANIQKDVLLLIAKNISEKIKVEGIIILSGLLFTDEDDILSCYTKLGLSFVEKMQLDEWISLVFKKLS